MNHNIAKSVMSVLIWYKKDVKIMWGFGKQGLTLAGKAMLILQKEIERERGHSSRVRARAHFSEVERAVCQRIAHIITDLAFFAAFLLLQCCCLRKVFQLSPDTSQCISAPPANGSTHVGSGPPQDEYNLV